MFPSEFCICLQDLEELNLSQNQITYIPENISAFSNLRKISVGWNKLTELPMGIFDLAALQELRAENNMIRVIPGQVGDLHALNTLVLNHNFISVIPLRCAELKFLVKVDLSENPVEICPSSILLLHQKNELLLQKSKRKGLIKRSILLKKTINEQLDSILAEEKKEIFLFHENESLQDRSGIGGVQEESTTSLLR